MLAGARLVRLASLLQRVTPVGDYARQMSVVGSQCRAVVLTADERLTVAERRSNNSARATSREIYLNTTSIYVSRIAALPPSGGLD